MISLYISFILGIIAGSLDLYLPGFLACFFFIKDHKKEVGIFLLALIIYFLFNPLIGEVNLPDKEERQNLVIKDIYEQGDKNFYLMEWEKSPFKKYIFKSEERAENIAGKIKRAANAKSLKNDIKDYLGYKISIKGEFLLFDKGGLAGEFDREKFYVSRGISGRLKINKIYDIKPAYSSNRFFYSLGRGLERQINKMPKEQAAFLKRLILAKTTEDESLQNNMKSLGLNHLLAASGLHVNLIFFLLLNLMAFLPLDRKKISITIIILLFIYGKIIRNPPSIMRAIYFCIFREWALITRRKISPVKMILLSLCLVVLPAPYRIRDKGLQLSFACVWAIEMKKSLEMDSFKEETFFDKLKTSFWISLMTLPILSSMSASISISSIFINPLVIPIFSKLF